jgi:hypothetical protein
VLVALGLNQHIENLALGVDGAPRICHPPIDLQIDFVKTPSRVRLRAALAQLRCNHRSEMIHPAAHGFVGDRDPALGQQILDVAKAEGEPETEPVRVINDFRREPIPRSRFSSCPFASAPANLQQADAGVTKPFRSLKTLQKFGSIHSQVHNHFNQERHLVTRQAYKQRRSAALAEWRALVA